VGWGDLRLKLPIGAELGERWLYPCAGVTLFEPSPRRRSPATVAELDAGGFSAQPSAVVRAR
jgi:hypothetical protein